MVPRTPAGERGWPCLRCGANVSIALDACPECGAGFLSGTGEAASLQVPGVGDLARANPGMRLAVGLVAAGVLCLLFLVVLFVLGKLL